MACGILLEIAYACARLLPRTIRRRLLGLLRPSTRFRIARRLMRWPGRGWPTWRPWPARWWSATDQTSRPVDLPHGRRIRDGARWVMADVSTEANPSELRQRNLDAVLEVVAGA